MVSHDSARNSEDDHAPKVLVTANPKYDPELGAKQPTQLVAVSEPWVRGNPGPFGLLCFGMTTDMLMFVTTGWAESTFTPTVFCYAMFYGGFGQFAAGTLELIKGNTFAGTAFCSYGCFWMGWFLLEYLSLTAKQYIGVMTVGMTLWAGLWAFLTFGFFIVTLRKNGGLMTIFSTLVITFALLAGGKWNEQCEKAAGYVGFLCGSSAIYTAFAELYHQELGITLPGVKPVKYI
eukprot:CAMPEP_0202900244 /NCGR_PEP_ID=MMETSP1392-20130828/10578_1 /ASSEMBLY_ACC=CAM_ASM_000868 /TAXON_ID=225041 /ORGANISM="Chlamydomonas chlamydogama, Strain SAG 11-48b" /LENGTH=232 /DNA_ID=CAMNT_0049586593 /DNA_START=73 /DNA_END=771 /DNA_ORIENTATION=-